MKEQNPNFQVFADDALAVLDSDEFPTELLPLHHKQQYVTRYLHGAHTYFGFSPQPYSVLLPVFGHIELPANAYFAHKGPLTIRAIDGFVVARIGYDGLNYIGGPIEHGGRLKYIDGCTDSLLVPPTKLGDPCLNLLYFPQGIKQTMHIHPSNRIGMIASGRGRCITPHGEVELQPGVVFCIPKNSEHCFYTDDSELRVVAFHPDSDYGPADESHPMIQKTIIGGVPANDPSLSALRTQ